MTFVAPGLIADERLIRVSEWIAVHGEEIRSLQPRVDERDGFRIQQQLIIRGKEVGEPPT